MSWVCWVSWQFGSGLGLVGFDVFFKRILIQGVFGLGGRGG